jgi:hypothetical protein
MTLALALTVHLSLAGAAPGGLHLLEPGTTPSQLTPPPVVSFDEAPGTRGPVSVAGDVKDLTLRVRALNERIRRLAPNWPLGATGVVCLGLVGLFEGLGLLPMLLLTSSNVLLPLVYFTVVIAVLALGVFWGYASWVGAAEERAQLITERDALQRRLDGGPGPDVLPAPVPSVQRATSVQVLLARF